MLMLKVLKVNLIDYYEGSQQLTSVMASTEAPYLSSSSTIFNLSFLQAIWRGVKPFLKPQKHAQIAY